jgi:hypothetical protein
MSRQGFSKMNITVFSTVLKFFEIKDFLEIRKISLKIWKFIANISHLKSLMGLLKTYDSCYIPISDFMITIVPKIKEQMVNEEQDIDRVLKSFLYLMFKLSSSVTLDEKINTEFFIFNTIIPARNSKIKFFRLILKKLGSENDYTEIFNNIECLELTTTGSRQNGDIIPAPQGLRYNTFIKRLILDIELSYKNFEEISYFISNNPQLTSLSINGLYYNNQIEYVKIFSLLKFYVNIEKLELKNFCFTEALWIEFLSLIDINKKIKILNFFECSKINFNCFGKTLQKNKTLTEIKMEEILSSSVSGFPNFLKLLPSISNITNFGISIKWEKNMNNLYNEYLNNLNMNLEILQKSLIRFPDSLIHLNLSNCNLEMKAMENLCKILSKDIRDLNLSNNKFSDYGLIHLCEWLLDSSLESLNISNCEFNSKGVKKLSVFFTNKKCKLIKINLSRNFINSQLIKNIFEGLKKNKTLKTINLAEINLQSEGIKYISDDINTTSLTELNLNGNPIKKSDLFILASELKLNSTIKILHLSKMITDDYLCCGLSKLIESASSLENLDISYNYLCKKQHFSTMCESLLKNTGLKIINLELSGIDDKELLTLSRYIQHNKSIERMILTKNRITEQALQDFLLLIKYTNIKDISFDNREKKIFSRISINYESYQ